MIEDLAELHVNSKLDTKWANSQACLPWHNTVNHLLRLLIRMVDPKHISAEFHVVDETSLRFVGCLFGMSAGELTPWRTLRITMPFRHGGLGIVSLVESSHAAYLGCLFRQREVLGNDPTNSIKGFKEAHAAIVNMVGEKVIPPVGTFFDKETKGPTSNVEDFAGHVQDMIWNKKQLEMHWMPWPRRRKNLFARAPRLRHAQIFSKPQSPIASTTYPRTRSKWQEGCSSVLL